MSIAIRIWPGLNDLTGKYCEFPVLLATQLCTDATYLTFFQLTGQNDPDRILNQIRERY